MKVTQWVKGRVRPVQAPEGVTKPNAEAQRVFDHGKKHHAKQAYAAPRGTPTKAPITTDRYSHNGVTKSWKGSVERGKLKYKVEGTVKAFSRSSSLDDDPRPTKAQRKALLKLKREQRA